MLCQVKMDTYPTFFPTFTIKVNNEVFVPQRGWLNSTFLNKPPTLSRCNG